MAFSKKQNVFFLLISCCASKIYIRFWTFWINLLVDVFLKLETTKDLARLMSKRPRFRTPLDNQHVKGSQTQLKPARQHFYDIISSLWEKWSLKMSLLLKLEILGLFSNTLTADDKYFLPNREKLPQPKQLQLSKKHESFSSIFYWFSEIYIKFRQLWIEKISLIADVFLKLESAKGVLS